jgi:hypothetical protein
MSGLHEAFDEIVADVPVYGDLERAIEQAERERRQRYGVVAGLAAAAAVVAVIVGMLAVTRNTGSAPPVAPPVSPTPTKSQGADTWVDTAVTPAEGVGWDVPDPLAGARDAWPDIVAGHLHVTPTQRHADWYHAAFEVPVEGSDYSTSVEFGVLEASRADGLLADGCSYLHPIPGDHRKESCRTEEIEGPDGEPVHVTSFQSLCTTFDPGSPGADARPAPGSFRTCGDYGVTVVAERSDGRIGWVDVDGRDYVEAMPFALTSLAAAAADPRLVLPDAAYEVPSDQTVASVVADHLPTWRAAAQRIPLPEPGRASTSGNLRSLGVSVSVWPAGGTPTCGRRWLVSCVERRVYGADDSTTVFVGAWGNEDCDFCSRNSRADSRVFVFVGPRNTVVVGVYLAAKAGDEPMSPDLDQRLIDLALDPRLQRS